jgi:hypothetical protein
MPVQRIPIRDFVPPRPRPRTGTPPSPKIDEFKEHLACAFYMKSPPPLPNVRSVSRSRVCWPVVRVAAVAALLLIGTAFLCAALLPSPRDRGAVADLIPPSVPVVEQAVAEPAPVRASEAPPRGEEHVAVANLSRPVLHMGPVDGTNEDLLKKEECTAPRQSVVDVGGRPVPELLGTTVEFLDNPLEASKIAARENKLLFVLHVSGNFEDPQFT